MEQIFKKTAIFIIFISCLFIQNFSFASDAISANQQSTPTVQNNQTNNSVQTDSDKNENVESIIPTNSKVDNEIPTTFTKANPQINKTFDFLKSSPKEPVKNLTATPNSRYTITFRGRSIDLKKHLHLTTLIALVGLTGTCFGLFSTWLIYHLNKKHNNPLIIDKHNSAIKYMDELNRIKIYFAHSDIKNLYSALNNATEDKQEELHRLVIAYEDICKNLSKIDILGIHTRYEKHMNKRKHEIFNSLIENYKMLKIDGDYLNQSGENYHIFNLENSINLNGIRHKIIIALTFEEQIKVILDILRKELKL